MDLIIKIKNFERYKGRSDVKNNSWFRLSNRILEDYDFFDFTDSEFKVWIYLLSLSSQSNRASVRVNYRHAKTVCRIEKKTIDSAVEKLIEIKAIEVEQKRDDRGRYVYVTDACATDRQTDITNKTDIHIQEKPTPSARAANSELPRLAIIWNDLCGSLPRVSKTNANRNKRAALRLSEHSEGEWEAIVKKIAQSSFCNGGGEKGWVADFDWLLRPETSFKVLEGKYDDRIPKNKGTLNQGYQHNQSEDETRKALGL